MQTYRPRQLSRGGDIRVRVPASKSLLNRALLLAAFTEGTTELTVGELSEDPAAMLGCLHALGIGTEMRSGLISVHGGSPRREANLNVESAGTAARFLPAILAFRGGRYTFTASPEMQRRPMGILSELEACGVTVERGENGWPFTLSSNGIRGGEATVDTEESTQYASGFLLAAALGTHPFTLRLTGKRSAGSYLKMTERMIASFGGSCTHCGDTVTVQPIAAVTPHYAVEPDLSGACYFYALALLLGKRVLVEGIHADTLQGDAAFLELLKARGVEIYDTAEGLMADGSAVDGFDGFCEDVTDFSDQMLTLATLAPFARTPSRLSGLKHTERQESNRIEAARENLCRMGAEATASDGVLTVIPHPVREATIATFRDHRVAMAFSLAGLATGKLVIEDPLCCGKTFPSFFDILESLR